MITVLVLSDIVLSVSLILVLVDNCRKQTMIDRMLESLDVIKLGKPLKTRIISPYLTGGAADEPD